MKITAVKAGKTYKGSAKDDIINIPASAGSNITVKAGAGKDRITVKGGKSLVLDAGTGNDTITVSAGTIKSVSLGSGTNKITVTGGKVAKIVGGSGNDTFHINNTSLNLFEGGTGNDTYNVSSLYGSTVIDNSSARSGDRDVLKIKGNINSVYNLAYDRSRDILMCNDIYIKGFKKLSSITVADGSSRYTASASDIIRQAYGLDLSGVNTEINAYNKNLNTIISKGFTTDYLAYSAGYYGK